MRALKTAFAAVLVGAALGVAARFVATGDARRGMIAMVAAFGVAVCAASAWNAGGDSIVTRCRSGAAIFVTTFVAAWTAAATSGNASLFGAAAVVAGAAAAAFGVATFARARGVGAAHAAFVGAAAPAVCAALLFVADPFIEWNGSTTADAPDRAAAVLSANPIASIGADAGVDWQRSTWLYVGPTSGSTGLSVTGRYYPSRPTSPWAWGLAAAAIGFAALAAARARDRLSA